MSLHQDLIEVSASILEHIQPPEITGLYLPPLRPEHSPFADEFGFIMLEGGAIGAFYVSLDDTLPQLWRQFPNPDKIQLPLPILLDKLLSPSPSLAGKALGIGAYNALSQHLMRLANYYPDAPTAKRAMVATDSAEPIGMVGYFAPLIKRLTHQGHTVRVLEKLPERVLPHPQVQFTDKPYGLADCRQVICTASTLVNESLDSILEACRNAEYFALTGPTAGGLPDVVFARGVTHVGAIVFPDAQQLRHSLENGHSWGKAGNKYDISRHGYPGLEQLLQRIPTA